MTGQRLLHYDILERLGAGGMGVVYKARDRHLDRFVAVKVLPPQALARPERKLRFVQEAKAASALNHPHIVTIYDIDQAEGVDFIAMEHVAGKPLDQLIPRHGMRLNEALKYAAQMADALAAAHEAGILHRDLKPGNVMVTDKGQVKVLDFGLAKLTAAAADDGEATRTLKPVTEEGTIIGTVAYMSPEQAEGRAVDGRSDVFSLGTVLYEMITGRRAFAGDTKASTMASILKEEPAALDAAVPHDVEKVVKRCLRKDPARRFQTMADLKVALEELKDESDSGSLQGAAPAKPRRKRAWAVALAVMTVIVAAGAWWAVAKRQRVDAPLKALPITTYAGTESYPSLSPDGTYVAFTWQGDKRNNYDIYVKVVAGSGDPVRLTTDPAGDFSPAWSPDGTTIAFVRVQFMPGQWELLTIPALGGPERKVTDLRSAMVEPYRRYVTWSPDGKNLVFSDGGSLFAYSLAGGEKRDLGFAHSLDPAYSPDGHRLAFVRQFGVGNSHLLVQAVSEELRPVGEARRLAGAHNFVSHPSWTADGREVIYSAGEAASQGLWRAAASGSVDPKPLGLPGAASLNPEISRNGRRLVYVMGSRTTNLWRIELEGHGEPRREKVAASSRLDHSPQYSPDGRRIAFSSSRSGNTEIWVCDADGSNAVQVTSKGVHSGTPRWFPDSRRIVFDTDKEGPNELIIADVTEGTSRRIAGEANQPSVSRDGKTIYFISARTGRQEVWKMPAEGGQAVQLTKAGGAVPFESRDAKRVYYLKAFTSPELWSTPVEGGEELKVLDGVFGRSYAVVPEGIYFISSLGAAGRYSLRFYRFATKAVTQIAGIEKPPFQGMSVSPDGRWALYTQIEETNADLMLVDNFR